MHSPECSRPFWKWISLITGISILLARLLLSYNNQNGVFENNSNNSMERAHIFFPPTNGAKQTGPYIEKMNLISPYPI